MTKILAKVRTSSMPTVIVGCRWSIPECRVIKAYFTNQAGTFIPKGPYLRAHHTPSSSFPNNHREIWTRKDTPPFAQSRAIRTCLLVVLNG